MQQQYSNHKRYNPAYHFFSVPLVIIGTILTAYNIYQPFLGTNNYLAILLFAMVVLLGLTGHLARTFALKAQDRGIIVAENLRYLSLTGRMLPAELQFGQIAALRFASEPEFVDLVKRTLKEQLSGTEIKKSIKIWKADTRRV